MLMKKGPSKINLHIVVGTINVESFFILIRGSMFLTLFRWLYVNINISNMHMLPNNSIQRSITIMFGMSFIFVTGLCK